MSDPLSVAAGVTGIAATGFAVAKGLYRIADGIGSAGQEVRIYGDEVGAFSKLLLRVRNELLQPTHSPTEDTSLIKDVLDICDRILAPLERLQKTLSPLLVRFRESSGKLRQFGIRIQWIFSRKAKLLFYREVLRGQHRVLDTTLELIILKVNRDKSPQNVYILQMSLEHSMSAVNHSLKCTNRYQQLEYGQQTESNQMTMIEGRESLNEVAEPRQNLLKFEGSTEERSSITDNSVREQEESNDMALVLSTSTLDIVEQLNEEEIQQLDEQVDEDLSSPSNDSAQELLEDMRSVSRKVLRLAAGVLHKSQSELEPESERLSTATSEDGVHELAKEMPVPIPVVAEVPTKKEEVDPLESKITLSSLKESDISDKIITLEIADGESYDLPYVETRTWEGILSLINEIYGIKWPSEPEAFQYDQYTRYHAIKDGDFTLYGPSRQIILPRLWSRVVKPGWIVKLRYKKLHLNEST